MCIQVSNINESPTTIYSFDSYIPAYLHIPILCEIEAQIFFIESIEYNNYGLILDNIFDFFAKFVSWIIVVKR